jgi:hypothetical protein
MRMGARQGDGGPRKELGPPKIVRKESKNSMELLASVAGLQMLATLGARAFVALLSFCRVGPMSIGNVRRCIRKAIGYNWSGC